MSNNVEVTVLMPVENFVVYKNKIRKEMSETQKEDLDAYKKFEWERAVETWGNSWNNIKNDRVRLDLLAQIRDLLGYTVTLYPCTKEEIDAASEKAKKARADKKEADRVAKVQAQDLLLKQWDSLTTEEKSAKLKQERKESMEKLLHFSIIPLMVIGFLAVYLVS